MNVRRTWLTLSLLAVAAFCLALAIEPWSRGRQSDRSGSVLALLLGDGRRLFANHFFAKADAYFHRGVYPSIFDPPRGEELHMVTEAAHAAEDHDEDHHEETPKNPGQSPSGFDWIAWMNEHLQPTDHAHLSGGNEREMLPWLKLAIELDPTNVQNYVIPSFWLRTRLGRVDEAEALIRQGLKENPGSADLLYELGLIELENRNDPVRARNILEVALRKWRSEQAGRAEPDNLLAEEILARLAYIEEQAGNLQAAIARLEQLEKITPKPAPVREHIDHLKKSL